ncbi:MAG: anhydro-N-acetylmuramic acid kinase, partial [Bacteroidales bacterium]
MQYNNLRVLGLMSGTSLDGLDLCLAQFAYENGVWAFEILAAQTYAYTDEMLQRLQGASKLHAFEFVKLHKEYGRFLGKQSLEFLQKNNLQADYIASHGHTIFHQPQQGVSFQLGDGFALAAVTACSTICDFRSLDVALTGQGAPLVPIADKLLFPQYDCCINLGGFANLSFEDNAMRVAFDVCPCNIVLNALSQQLGVTYDQNGGFASQGSLNATLLQELNALEFYVQKGAKSLGREW